MHAWQVADKPAALQPQQQQRAVQQDATQKEALEQAPPQQQGQEGRNVQQQVLSLTEDQDRLATRLADAEAKLAALRRTDQERTARCALSSRATQYVPLCNLGKLPIKLL